MFCLLRIYESRFRKRGWMNGVIVVYMYEPIDIMMSYGWGRGRG